MASAIISKMLKSKRQDSPAERRKLKTGGQLIRHRKIEKPQDQPRGPVVDKRRGQLGGAHLDDVGQAASESGGKMAHKIYKQWGGDANHPAEVRKALR